jgi:hypothetical protein
VRDSGQQGAWGFKAVAGRYVGGGLFTKVKLDADEKIDEYLPATHAGASWFDEAGYLSVTDRRLIHTPYRWPITILGSRPTIVRYEDIARSTAERRPEPDKPASFVASALIVEVVGGKRHVFWPAADAESLAETIERTRISRDS